MSYSLCGFLIRSEEEAVCAKHNWPFVSLTAGVSIIPLERDYLFLTEGFETSPQSDFEFVVPQWLSEMVLCFSKSAYIEAEFWGGEGMQASIVFAGKETVDGPAVSTGAINFALRHLGICDERSVTLFRAPAPTGKDPFAIVGLGRHRSVSGWLQESGEKCTLSKSHRTGP